MSNIKYSLFLYDLINDIQDFIIEFGLTISDDQPSVFAEYDDSLKEYIYEILLANDERTWHLEELICESQMEFQYKLIANCYDDLDICYFCQDSALLARIRLYKKIIKCEQ